MSTRWCCNTVKRNERRNEIRFSNRQHKIQKKTCINRHIIKYYVVTEHILFHGVAMETDFWRMRRSFADLPPLIHWPVTVVRASSTSAQSIRINRKHVSKETIAKNIKSFLQERERERERTRRETAWKWLAEILVYSPSFHNLCCQYLTGSWQGRPGCDYLLTSLSAHTGSFCECVCVHLSSRMTFPAFFLLLFFGVCVGCVWGGPPSFHIHFVSSSSLECHLSLAGRCQCSVTAGTRLSWRPISSSTWARRLRLPSGKCWASHKSRITPVGLDLVAK